MKREMDKTIYLAAPLFPPEFFHACTSFMNLCFATFQGWGVDARLRTPSDRRAKAADASWQPAWNDCFADAFVEPPEVRRSYQEIMAVFAREIGLNPELSEQPLGNYSSNITPRQ